MRVSIITVCYNSEKTISDCIKSVALQSYSNIEHIIVDGKSTDKTLEIINSLGSKITHLISEEDKGIYDAINKGIILAQGDVIGILNSDDFYATKDVIKDVVTRFLTEKTDSIYGDIVYVSNKNINHIRRYWRAGSYKDEKFFYGWMPPHPTFFVRKKIYDTYGLYNTNFKIAADYEFMLRMLHKHKITTTYIPKVLVKMRMGGISNVHFKNRILANQEDRKAWQINGLKPRFYTRFLKPLSKIFQYF